jgi:hypothetical protein
MGAVKVYTQEELDKALKSLKNGDWIELWGDKLFEIHSSSQVTAYGSSQVTAYGSSQVTAYGSSQVRAYGSSQVRAYGSSQVTAYGSSQVTACGSSQVRASKYVAVTITGGTPKIIGGVQIHYKAPTTAKAWLENYAVPTKNGVAILFKAVRTDYKSAHGTSYAPGETPKATDWDSKPECGGGLHFCPNPALALYFDNQATKFVACPVKVSEIVVHKNPQYPTKIKAPRVCAPCYEVDIHGNRLKDK